MLKKMKRRKQVLDALALFEDITADQWKLKRKGNRDVNQLTETATLKINETSKIKELYKIIGEFTESEKKTNEGKTKG